MPLGDADGDTESNAAPRAASTYRVHAVWAAVRWRARIEGISAAAPLLVLRDIDHTLVSVAGVSRMIYDVAFEKVTDRPMVHLVDMAGWTEQAIIRETLALNGAERR